MRGGQHAHGSAMEGTLEGQDGQIGRARRLVDHARLHLLFGEADILAALLPPVPHKHVLVSVLVGARAAHHGGQLSQPLGRHLGQDLVEPLGPVLTRKHAQRRPIHQRFLQEGVPISYPFSGNDKILDGNLITYHVIGVVQHSQQVGVVVAEWHGGDLRVHVQHTVAVGVHEVVAQRALIVCEKLHGSRLLKHNPTTGQKQHIPVQIPRPIRLAHGSRAVACHWPQTLGAADGFS